MRRRCGYRSAGSVDERPLDDADERQRQVAADVGERRALPREVRRLSDSGECASTGTEPVTRRYSSTPTL